MWSDHFACLPGLISPSKMRSSAEYRSRGSTGWLLGPIISSVVPLDDIETLLSIDVAKPPLQRPPAVYVAEQMHASPTPTRPAAHPTLPTASSYAYPTFPSYVPTASPAAFSIPMIR
ncbi:hypothetical protein DPSP01_002028 [Paraphaeosphaeria sporulosa]